MKKTLTLLILQFLRAQILSKLFLTERKLASKML